MINKTDRIMGECRRCGTCCGKGGPAMHLQDQDLVESGKIPLNHLFTIRQGEPAFDNVADTLTPAPTDIIKVQSCSRENQTCRYYSSDAHGCEIYDYRPTECQALKCWDTLDLEALYNRNRLTRRHLLSAVDGLWDLVREHQQRCSYATFSGLAAGLKNGLNAQAASEALLDMICYDQSIRQTIMEKQALDIGLLLFLFGRPMTATMGFFQLKLVREETGLSIQPFVVHPA